MKVDYAIKESDELICITEDKVQQKLTEGFAQNIKQLESSFQTNKRKRKREILQASKAPFSIEFVEEALVENSEEYKTLRKGVKKVLDPKESVKHEVENAKFRNRIELEKSKTDTVAENARRDVRVRELEQKNTELETRLAIVEQASLVVDEQKLGIATIKHMRIESGMLRLIPTQVIPLKSVQKFQMPLSIYAIEHGIDPKKFSIVTEAEGQQMHPGE
ncbi:hypothetical protein C1645_831458 [Glomus cerebriforme]|uniref:Uncharacterized protein n=1 Tax=Glomus cerebriforme TaxID=658196 RepID=A0A397SK27_9GLOM|nr:hypothetical protein C1645_831458 [Glomus cerebriforme]